MQPGSLGLGADHFGTFAHQASHLNGTQLQALSLGLQAGPVQQVVDQMREVLAGPKDFVQWLRLGLLFIRLHAE